MRYILLTALCSLLFLSVGAQNKNSKMDVTGQWKGKITQNEGGYKTSYEFEIYLTQKGNEVTGRSYVFIDDIFAIMELKGKVKGGKVLLLEETRIVDHKKHEDMEWCIKKAQLLLKKKDDQHKLEGFWQGKSVIGECVPGKIFLEKEIPKA